MFYSAIELRQTEDSAMVAKIAAETIRAIYPRYYPAGAVEFFAELHSQMEVEKVKNREEIFLAAVQGEIVGTGSIRNNEICRLFILPEYQGKGYGSLLMDILEKRILEKYGKVHVDASFPAESMYFKRGYKIIAFEKIEIKNGDYLCYHTMEKVGL